MTKIQGPSSTQTPRIAGTTQTDDVSDTGPTPDAPVPASAPDAFDATGGGAASDAPAAPADRGAAVASVLAARAPPAPELDDVEFKVLLDPAQLDRLSDLLGLDDVEKESRATWFFDTPDLELMNAGVVLRARQVEDKKDKSTIKVRPLAPDAVDPEWLSKKGVKFEFDVTGDKRTPSWSIKNKIKTDDVDRAVTKYTTKSELERVYNDKQLEFLAEYAPVEVDLKAVKRLGPIQSFKWEPEVDAVGGRLDVEIWELPDGRRVLELSQRADGPDAEDAQKRLDAWLDDNGFARAQLQSSKTRLALEYFTGASQDPAQDA
jgi:hypothetical protein